MTVIGPIRILHCSFGFFREKGSGMPRMFKDNLDATLANNPNWRIVTWQPAQSRALIAARYPDLLPIYDGFPHGVQRSDLSRYAALHAFGGVYADLDYVWKVPLDKAIGAMIAEHPGSGVLLNGTPNRVGWGTTNSLMIALEKEHPYWLAMMKAVKESKPHKWATRHAVIMSTTGPTLLTQVARKYMSSGNAAEKAKPISSLSNDSYNPCGLCAKASCRHKSGVMGYHDNASSWTSASSRFFQGLLCNWVMVLVILLAVIIFAVTVTLLALKLRKCKSGGL